MTDSKPIFDEPWIGSLRLGNGEFTLDKPVTGPTTLAAKQALLFHLLEKFIGPLTGKRILDIGSNQGYTSLEALLRGANIVAIEPYHENFKKTKYIFEKNGFWGSRAELYDDIMENLSFEKYGKFDGIMFLGTIYHSEKPWEILNKISKMTDLVIIESQISFPKEVNSTVGEYQFKAFEEGPGTDLDDPEKNYLRQVRRCTVRVPTCKTLGKMIYDAGFNLVLKVEYSNKNSSGTLSKLYTDTGRGVFFIGQRCDIAHVLFNR